jgi:hypothetical protein
MHMNRLNWSPLPFHSTLVCLMGSQEQALMHLVLHCHALQSAAPLQTPNPDTLEELEFETPAVETAKPRDLLTSEEMAAADAVSRDQCPTGRSHMVVCAFCCYRSLTSATRVEALDCTPDTNKRTCLMHHAMLLRRQHLAGTAQCMGPGDWDKAVLSAFFVACPQAAALVSQAV